MKKKVVLLIVIVLIISIQFIRVDQSNPYSDPKSEFALVASVPDNVYSILRESCYDCHSNNTAYPWYSNIAPVSWILQNHIKEGREHMNFTEWGNYSVTDRFNMMEECIEEIDKGKMPLKPYLLMHPKAKLTAEEKETVRQWFLGNSSISVIAALN